MGKEEKQIATWKRLDYAKMKIDPARAKEFAEHKIKSNTSRRLREILGQDKSERCLDYVGCSLEKFRIHLESKFADGMSWKNYGENARGGKTEAWHIDHIIPCTAFDMTNPVHQKACFHYKNLQPLWWTENIRKHAYYDVEEKTRYIQRFIETYIL